MILATVFSLLISGGSDPSPHILVGYKDETPFAFEAKSIGPDTDGKLHFLQKEAAESFNRMKEAASLQGIRLDVNYGYRSHLEQIQIRSRYRGLAAKPGKSPHEEGIAIDLNHSKRRSPVFRWLVKNAATFGFHNTINYEPWHWEFSRKEIDNGN